MNLWIKAAESIFLTFQLVALLVLGIEILPNEIVMSEEMLTFAAHLCSQSKLSQDELNQLQKDTHFDKKELQQWYKGWLAPSNFSL